MPDGSPSTPPFIDVVQEAARKLILFLPHAVERMNLPDKIITTFLPDARQWSPDFKQRLEKME